MALEIDIFSSLIFNFHLLQFLTTLPYKSKNSTESNFLRRIISAFFALWSDLFWFWNRSKPKLEGNRTSKKYTNVGIKSRRPSSLISVIEPSQAKKRKKRSTNKRHMLSICWVCWVLKMWKISSQRNRECWPHVL